MVSVTVIPSFRAHLPRVRLTAAAGTAPSRPSHERRGSRPGVRALSQRRIPRVGSAARRRRDRKSTRLNSSHITISYAVFCLKKKKKNKDKLKRKKKKKIKEN